jgi:EpsI family protein
VLSFPLLFLFFAVPVGHFLVPTLVDLTADFTVAAIRLTGIPIYRDGNQLEIPSGSWSVTDSCSGIRYLIASLMGGVLFAHLFYRSLRKRLAFIVLAIAAPLVANWVRAYMIIMLGHLSNNRIAAGVDHLIYGWLFFGVVMITMFSIGARYADPQPRLGHAPRQPQYPGARLRINPVLFGTIILLAMWRPAVSLLPSPEGGAVQLPPLAAFGQWSAVDGGVMGWKPHYLHAVAERTQTFSRGGERVGLFIAYYRNQRQDSELIHTANGLLPPGSEHWRSVTSRMLPVHMGDARVSVQAVRLRSGAGDLAVWQWYWVAGQTTVSPYLAKALLLRARLTGRGDDSAGIVVYTPVQQPQDASERILADFVRASWPSILHALEQAKGERP